MESSILLLRIIGFVSLINAFAMILNKKETQQVFVMIAKNRALSYLIGTLMMTLGVIVTTISFDMDALAVKIFGLTILFEGIFFMVGHHKMIKKYIAPLQNDMVYYGIVLSYLILPVLLLLNVY